MIEGCGWVDFGDIRHRLGEIPAEPEAKLERTQDPVPPIEQPEVTSVASPNNDEDREDLGNADLFAYLDEWNRG